MRRSVLLLAAAAALALPAPAAAAKRPQSLTLSVGAPTQTLSACGAGHATSTAARGAKLAAAVRLAEPPGLRWGGRRARLLVDRCEDGRWRRVSSARFGTRGPYRRVRSYRLALPTGASADLRVRATVAGDKHRRAASSRPAYVRVGVGELVDVPLGFEVDNVNRTRVPCEPDGRRYPIAGHLVAPRAAIDRPDRSVTVFLHGIEVSSSYFRYRSVPGYDFQNEMAELGHATIVYDRLGHGDSGLPPAGATCVGAQADVAHQVLDLVRSGDYSAGGAKGRAFPRVALGGHSFGSYMAEITAMTFRNQDVLVLMTFAAEGIDVALLADRQSRGEAGSCNTSGGHEKKPGGPSGYAYLWPDRDIWGSDTFFNAEPGIVEESEERVRERSACGEINSAVPAAFTETPQYNQITTPVIMIFGRQDQLFPPPAGERHRTFFTGSDDVTFHEIDQAGHTLMLQRSAPEFRQKLSDWLRKRGF
ncbi:MAG TPA: alpha/beta hydrolase [Thermoleophilaceae bacterium]|jgi:pimeloyl-ACP methyl ester carboxylesterase